MLYSEMVLSSYRLSSLFLSFFEYKESFKYKVLSKVFNNAHYWYLYSSYTINHYFEYHGPFTNTEIKSFHIFMEPIKNVLAAANMLTGPNMIMDVDTNTDCDDESTWSDSNDDIPICRL